MWITAAKPAMAVVKQHLASLGEVFGKQELARRKAANWTPG
jgi:hypothetical protein